MPPEQQSLDVSIIIPVLDEAVSITESLERLLDLVPGDRVEIIVVDGGSMDETAVLAARQAVTLTCSSKGRASQMNTGAAIARGEYLVFLHIDTYLPANFVKVVAGWMVGKPEWGFFRLCLSSAKWPFRIIEKGINWRSRLTGAGTGDQVFFCRRQLFDSLGGFPDIALMEDVALSRVLNKHTSPCIETSPVVTSSRRWEDGGICRTIIHMWALRIAYYCGASPDWLVKRYHPQRDTA